MRKFFKGLAILPIFLTVSGFGPFDLKNEETNFASVTHINLENKTYLSKEDLDQKLAKFEAKAAAGPVIYQRRKALPGFYIVSATAYSSTVDQCDASQFITASGQHVRDGIIAANFLPFGAKVRIPEIYGDKIFEVQDRMNSRYTTRVDLWMPTRQAAMQFGLRQIKIEVL